DVGETGDSRLRPEEIDGDLNPARVHQRHGARAGAQVVVQRPAGAVAALVVRLRGVRELGRVFPEQVVQPVPAGRLRLHQIHLDQVLQQLTGALRVGAGEGGGEEGVEVLHRNETEQPE